MTAPGGQVLGLDVEQADQLAQLMDQTSQQFNDSATQLTNQLGQVRWVGAYADRFRDTWNSQARTNLNNIVQMLQEASQQLKQHAQAQRQVSGN